MLAVTGQHARNAQSAFAAPGKDELRTTMAYMTGNRTTTMTLGNRLTEIGSQFYESYTAWRLYRRTLSELQDLSVRELNDFGLNPSTLRQAALDAAYGKRV